MVKIQQFVTATTYATRLVAGQHVSSRQRTQQIIENKDPPQPPNPRITQEVDTITEEPPKITQEPFTRSACW